MAITTIVVSGKIVKPDGTAQVGGKIQITPVTSGTVDDAGTEQQVSGALIVDIGQDGSVNFNIIPSAEYTGGSIDYNAKFILPDGSVFTKVWTVPGTATDIGDL
ncbi:MAG: hypothetical protein OES34_11495 [Nitrosopumilus sp.]|nr:hypothetical protein [Nitrosopumilus sp.]